MVVTNIYYKPNFVPRNCAKCSAMYQSVKTCPVYVAGILISHLEDKTQVSKKVSEKSVRRLMRSPDQTSGHQIPKAWALNH